VNRSNTLMAEAYVNNIWTLSSYLIGNTLHHHYKAHAG
jgi:hypothetical protein